MKHCDKSKDQPKKFLRRPKSKPCDDFWHTLHVGLPIAGLLFLTLPGIFALIF